MSSSPSSPVTVGSSSVIFPAATPSSHLTYQVVTLLADVVPHLGGQPRGQVVQGDVAVPHYQHVVAVVAGGGKDLRHVVTAAQVASHFLHGTIRSAVSRLSWEHCCNTFSDVLLTTI